MGRNKYECIAGHTRCEAAKRAGLKLIPARVLELDDDEACYYMATSNHQREDLLPSVKARMYKTEYEAIRKTAGRKKNGGQVGHYLKSIDVLAENSNDSRKQIQRYLKLNDLIYPLLDLVDEKKIGFVPGVELAYISPEGQEYILSIIESNHVKVTFDMAKGLRTLPKEAGEEEYRAVMLPEKLTEREPKRKMGIKLSCETKKKYFPPQYTEEEIEAVLIKLLEAWKREKIE